MRKIKRLIKLIQVLLNFVRCKEKHKKIISLQKFYHITDEKVQLISVLAISLRLLTKCANWFSFFALNLQKFSKNNFL